MTHALHSFSLVGRKALVTGCSRGIGQAIGIAMAQAGADIIGVSSGLSEGSELEAAVHNLGKTFTGYRCDFGNTKAVTDWLEQLDSEHPDIDILVNNAGIIRRTPARDHVMDDWDEVIQINLSTPFQISQSIGRRMLDRNYGRVIFTASLLSFQGGITVPGYAASKGGIAQLTKALSNEWAAQGVTVNAIAPGYIDTENTKALQQDPVRSKAILDRIPAGRWGRPEDIAGAAVFLASDAAGYVTGEVLTVDGGWMGW